MKISAKQYAIALYETTHKADEKDLKEILKLFTERLIKNGHINLFCLRFRIIELICIKLKHPEKV